jgi:hypothetical protein
MRIFLLSLIPLAASLTGCGKPASVSPASSSQDYRLSYTSTTCQGNLNGQDYWFHVASYSNGYVQSACRTGATGGRLSQTAECDDSGHVFTQIDVDGAAWSASECTTTTGITE